MKKKIISMVLLTAILSIFALSLISAANFSLAVSSPQSLTKSINQTNFTITPTAPQGTLLNIIATLPTTVVDSKNNTINLISPYSYTFNNVATGETKGPVQIAISSVPTAFIVGEYTLNVQVSATDASNSSNTLTQTVPVKFINDFCSKGEKGTDLEITSVDIRNADGDDTDWTPLDSITIKVDVSNEADVRVRDVNVELGLIDKEGKNIARDLENLDNRKISLGSINDGDEKTAQFDFQVPVDFNEEDYKLVIKAYSDDLGESDLCTAHSSDLENTYYQIVKGERETDEEKQVIISNIVLSADTVQCGEKAQLTAEVVNVGDTDYQDAFKVTLYNKELGLNTEEIIKDDLNQGDSYSVDLEFDVPKNAAEKSYILELKTYYDYDDNDESFDITSDTKFTKTIKVLGNCAEQQSQTKTPILSAELDTEQTPEVIAGKDVAVKVTIKNQDTAQQTYRLSVLDNSEWSQLTSINPQTLVVNPGETKEATVMLKLNADSEGSQDFTIKATYGSANDLSVQQRVTLEVTKTSFNNPFLDNIKANWLIYLIIVVNIILIVAIIAVIVRISSRPRRA